MGSGATVGVDQYPAKFSFDATTASCSSDFVAFNTGLTGSATQASVIAYSNLYSGCGGTVPSTYWAYDTLGTASSSIVLSIDGSQIAFVEKEAGVATLVILKWQASTTDTAGAPTVLSNTSSSSYRACSAPCMVSLPFTNGPADSVSAPYYDYTPGSDTLFVGDDSGRMHKFTGVFSGTPSEAGSPWPVLTGPTRLSSPIFDPSTGNVFALDQFTGSGGRLIAVCATSTCAGVSNGSVTVAIGTRTTSRDLVGFPGACHTTVSTNLLNLGPPMLDSTAGKLYLFVGNDGAGNSAVYQFSTTVSSTQFSQNSCGREATVGGGTTSITGNPMYAGAFDNLYLTSASGTSPSGNLYVCGNTAGQATLYQVPITSNVMAASGTSVLAVSSGITTCSPITEVYNGTSDLLFFGVQSLGANSPPVNCPTNAGCLMSFIIPTTAGGSLPSGTTATLGASGGTSGIVIDNIVTPGTLSTSQVYFSTLTGGTSVQASQALLQ